MCGVTVQVGDTHGAASLAKRILAKDPGNAAARVIVAAGSGPPPLVKELLASAGDAGTGWPVAAELQRSIQDGALERMLPLVTSAKLRSSAEPDSASADGGEAGMAVDDDGAVALTKQPDSAADWPRKERLVIRLDRLAWTALVSQARLVCLYFHLACECARPSVRSVALVCMVAASPFA